jgi:hypothetical protein
LLLCVLDLLVIFASWVGLILAPNYLYDVHDLSLRTVGQFFSLMALGSIVTGLLISRVAWLSRPLNGLVVPTLFLPPVFALLVLGSSAWVFGLGFLIFGIASVAGQMFYAVIGETTPAHLRTRSFALFEVMTSLGYMLAGFAAGALYGIDPILPLWAAFGASLVVVAATLLARRYLSRASAESGLQPAPSSELAVDTPAS